MKQNKSPRGTSPRAGKVDHQQDTTDRPIGQGKPFLVEIRVLDKAYLGDKNPRQRREVECDGYLIFLNHEDTKSMTMLMQGSLSPELVGKIIDQNNPEFAAGIVKGSIHNYGARKGKEAETK
jgi:hypothetical protein